MSIFIVNAVLLELHLDNQHSIKMVTLANTVDNVAVSVAW